MFKGKAIYNPSGKAGEYSYWACNFYVGCSNDCSYCYCKKGVLGSAMGGTTPTLKKCFKDEKHALQVFEKELLQNLEDLQKHGIFFTFTSDPMLEETIALNWEAAVMAIENNVPVKFLTKSVGGWVNDLTTIHDSWKKYIAIGLTLTGHDELEPCASTNAERIESMKILHEGGYKTFASIEPIIDFESSKEMIRKTAGYCDLYKIGLESGKQYDKDELLSFIEYCNSFYTTEARTGFYKHTNYFKDSLLKLAGIERSGLPDNCVTRDYNLFKSFR